MYDYDKTHDRLIKMLKYHEYATLLPAMSEEELEAMKEDIRTNGIHTPIVMHGGKILDGRHRYEAAISIGMDIKDIPFTELPKSEDPMSYAVGANLHRRHLNPSQRALVVAKFSIQDKQKNRTSADKYKAEFMNVSLPSVSHAKKVLKKGTSEIISAIENGEISVSDAAKIADRDTETQNAALLEKRTGRSSTLKGAVDVLDNAKLASVAATDIPTGKYCTIVVDPPWPVDFKKRDAEPNQSVAVPYPTMTLAEISELDIRGLAADNCWLLLWSTNRFLPSAFTIIEDWGFQYRWCLAWNKKDGMQHTNSPKLNLEHVIVASIGKPKWASTKQFWGCFSGELREHSRKPEEFYNMLKRVAPVPRLDMFSRHKIDGFDTWGNEL